MKNKRTYKKPHGSNTECDEKTGYCYSQYGYWNPQGEYRNSSKINLDFYAKIYKVNETYCLNLFCYDE